MKRNFAFLLSLLIAAQVTVCGESGQPSETTASPSSDTSVSTEESVETGRDGISDELTTSNFNGQEYVILPILTLPAMSMSPNLTVRW